MIGILCAGDREVDPFISMIDDCQIIEKAMLKFYIGKIDGVDIVTLYSGVCKVNAAIAVQILIDSFNCDMVINSGTAGGMDKRLKIFDTVIATEAAYHDVADNILTEFHPWLDSVFFRSDNNILKIAEKIVSDIHSPYAIYFGRMVTGEKFIQDDMRDEINEKYGPLSIDMETAAIAHVCYVNKIPFVAVRTITDTADHSGTGEFEKNCDIASEISADIVRRMLVEVKETFIR